MFENRNMIKYRLGIFSLFFVYIFSFFVIYSSGSVITSMVENSPYRIIARNIIIMISFFLTLAAIKVRKNLEIISIMTLVTGILLLTNILTFPTSTLEYFYYLLRFVLLIGVCLYCELKNIDLLAIIYNILMIIIIFSFVCYVFINIFNFNLPHSYIHLGLSKNTNYYYNYFGFYFYRPFGDAIYRVGDIEIVRLSALFWEPGVYGIFLNFELFMLLYKDQKKRKIKLIVILISIILTFSTSCWMATVILFAAYVSEKFSIQSKKIAFMILGMVAFLISAYIFLQKYKMTSGSIRVLDFTVGLKLFFENFWIGIGYKNMEPFIIKQGWGRSCSNGLVTWLFNTGILGGVFLFLPLIKNYIYNRKYIVYIMIFVIWNMGEPIITMSFISLLVAYEYSLFLARVWRK